MHADIYKCSRLSLVGRSISKEFLTYISACECWDLPVCAVYSGQQREAKVSGQKKYTPAP